MPPWPQRTCRIDTNNCDGHGACNAEGKCVCETSYYNATKSGSCKDFCAGEIDEGLCLTPQHFYIGVQTTKSVNDKDEVLSMIRLTISLINNKTDGFFDDETKHVYLHAQFNDSGCNTSIARNAVEWQNSWAARQKHALDGVIGDHCTDARSFSTIIYRYDHNNFYSHPQSRHCCVWYLNGNTASGLRVGIKW